MIKDQIKEKTDRIDGIIDSFLPKEEGAASTVISAMNYSIHVGGKRLRPMMMAEVFGMFSGEHEDKILYPFMAAIEMIHTYSLCHDDLPAMDNDMYRRGKKSTHAMYGEAMGILAGDALLNYAFETALLSLDRIASADIDAGIRTLLMQRIGHALKILAAKAGIYGMIGGQVVDIESEGKSGELSMDTIKFIHENKTAAMIESSMMIGAVLGGATDKELEIIESVGSDIGLAFQIRDDILDITGDEKTLGKPVGSDERNDKTTYVSLVGLEQAGEDVRTISERALASLDALPGSDTESGRFMHDLIVYLTDRDR